MKKLKRHPAPHVSGKSHSTFIMLCVVAALLPAAVTGCLNYGMRAVMLLGVTTGTAVLSELIITLLFQRPTAILDCSAIVTGLMLGMMLPPLFPMEWAAAGSAFAIIIVKQLFGGIGKNFANPALTAKALLMLLFMTQMHTYLLPQSQTAVMADALPGASWWDMLLGNTAGCIGETCTAGLLAGGIFLCLAGIISPAAPLGYLGSFALLTAISGNSVIPELLSGGLMLAAFFAATDYTTTPLTTAGKLIFGLGCGFLTFVIRHFGGYQDGAGLAVLCMNLFTPCIDRLTRTKPFGQVPYKRPARQKATVK